VTPPSAAAALEEVTGWSGLAKGAEQLFSDLSDAFTSSLDNATALQIAQLSLMRSVVKKTKKDLMQVLESAIKQAGNSGSMRQYRPCPNS
jgi:hypothetical protein